MLLSRSWPLVVCLSAACGGESNRSEATATSAPSSVSPPPSAAPAVGENRKRTVYVPAYSHLRTSRDGPTLYAITLSVRNVDPTASVTLTHVDYFDTSGHRVRSYLSGPKSLRPLETAEFFVESKDDAGGSGANFLVYWEGPSDAHALLTEAIMIGFMGAGYNAFTSRGVELPSRPEIPPAAPPRRSTKPSEEDEAATPPRGFDDY